MILGGLIAMPVVAVVRRWLMPAMPEDPRRRRRRAYTTGGLSPLHKARMGVHGWSTAARR